MRRFLISVVVLLGFAAAPANAFAGILPVVVARHAIRDWVRSRERSESAENDAELVGVRTSSCRRRSRSDVVCDGVSNWSDRRPDGTRYVCLIARVSARLDGGAVRVHQLGFQEIRCGPGLRSDEESVGIVH